MTAKLPARMGCMGLMQPRQTLDESLTMQLVTPADKSDMKMVSIIKAMHGRCGGQHCRAPGP